MHRIAIMTVEKAVTSSKHASCKYKTSSLSFPRDAEDAIASLLIEK